MTNFARENDSSEATIDDSEIFSEGAFKNVYKGKYTKGERKGEECVIKMFKLGSVFEESYFKNELKVVEKALEIVNQFNKDGIINKDTWLNMPTVWTFVPESKRAGEKCLVVLAPQMQQILQQEMGDASRQECLFQNPKGSRAPLNENGVAIGGAIGVANGPIDSGYASMNHLPDLMEELEIIEE